MFPHPSPATITLLSCLQQFGPIDGSLDYLMHKTRLKYQVLVLCLLSHSFFLDKAVGAAQATVQVLSPPPPPPHLYRGEMLLKAWRPLCSMSTARQEMTTITDPKALPSKQSAKRSWSRAQTTKVASEHRSISIPDVYRNQLTISGTQRRLHLLPCRR